MLRLLVAVGVGAVVGALMGYFGKCSTGACPLTANPFRGALYGGVMGLLFGLSTASTAGRGGSGGQAAGESPSAGAPSAGTASATVSGTHVLHVTSQEVFEESVLRSDRPVAVDFYASWCGPCKTLAPTIETLGERYGDRARVVKVDVDAAPDLARRYGVRGVPTVVFFEGGQERERAVGVRLPSYYEGVLDGLLKSGEGGAAADAR